ncbi:MAG: phosphate/phosphite/phosphonate ABC transporter substrate-binding protein [Planctomycetaceae bacterium]|nr:phosphate/phosphite/phosphonate ABC transporter substrate-binding protein [Planctomycetaceae bacterium]
MKNLLPLALLLAALPALAAEKKPDEPKKTVEISKDALVMVVMDPLAAPLSCPCVEGYAQRDYDKLAAFLTSQLGREVVAVYNASLPAALKMDTKDRADIVVGKHSVVLFDGKRAGKQFRPVLALTGKDGKTDMQGLFVVASSDPAKSVADLAGYRVFYGTEDSDEKYSAAFDLLKKHGITPTDKPETCAACSDGATKILELGPTARTATVISSYAAPLLEGCGTVKKGDLRVIGTTANVPFVEAFVSEALPPAEQAKIEAALTKMGTNIELMQAMESLLGFVPIAPQKKR